MTSRITLVFPADARIAVVQRRGVLDDDGNAAWVTGPQWQREPDTNEIIATFNRGLVDELEMCMAACRRKGEEK